MRHVLTLGGLALLLAGCAAARVTRPVPPVPPTPTAHEEGWQYEIQPGDELSIKLFYHPALNEDVIVRPDGRISLQLVDEIVAAGRTAQEIKGLLRARYGETLEKPEVAVIVKSVGNQRVFVAGEVGRPGEQLLRGRTTALQAIAMAQGFKDSARVSEVLVIRRQPDFSPFVMKVNLKRVVDGSDMRNDIVLLPYDVVFVPRSQIANFNKFMREFVINNLPGDFGFRVDLYK